MIGQLATHRHRATRLGQPVAPDSLFGNRAVVPAVEPDHLFRGVLADALADAGRYEEESHVRGGGPVAVHDGRVYPDHWQMLNGSGRRYVAHAFNAAGFPTSRLNHGRAALAAEIGRLAGSPPGGDMISIHPDTLGRMRRDWEDFQRENANDLVWDHRGRAPAAFFNDRNNYAHGFFYHWGGGGYAADAEYDPELHDQRPPPRVARRGAPVALGGPPPPAIYPVPGPGRPDAPPGGVLMDRHRDDAGLALQFALASQAVARKARSRPRREPLDAFLDALNRPRADLSDRAPFADYLAEYHPESAEPETLAFLRSHVGPAWVARHPETGRVTAGPHWTMAEIRAANAAAGRLWFDRGAMRYWGTRLHGEPVSGPGGTYFLTSDDTIHRDRRHYNIRQFGQYGAGDIGTASEFNAPEHAVDVTTPAEMRRRMRELAWTHPRVVPPRGA